MDGPPDVQGAAERAVEAGDAQGLRALLSSPEGDTISRGTFPLPVRAVRKGDAQSLRVLEDFGFVLCTPLWAAAAALGHVNCLELALSLRYRLEDRVLVDAVLYGQLASVEFLLRQGLPREPFVHSVFRAQPDQLECLQLMLDKGIAVNPKTLILAASRGDVDFVRWLHQRGVPLWREARDARHKSTRYVREFPCGLMTCRWQTVEDQAEPPGTIAIPWEGAEREAAPPWLDAGTPWHPCGLEDTWKALRYGAVFGAPVTPIVERVFAKKRERTHAVLLCFKAAARLRTGPGRAKQRRMWGGMAALPSCLIEELLILADLEIPESVVRRLLLTPPVTAP